jgi:hypothetical protein
MVGSLRARASNDAHASVVAATVQASSPTMAARLRPVRVTGPCKGFDRQVGHIQVGHSLRQAFQFQQPGVPIRDALCLGAIAEVHIHQPTLALVENRRKRITIGIGFQNHRFIWITGNGFPFRPWRVRHFQPHFRSRRRVWPRINRKFDGFLVISIFTGIPQ